MNSQSCAALRMRSIEEELAEVRLNLLHASRLAVTGQLLSAILHEMHQPLTAVRLRARNGRDMLENAEGPNEAIRTIFDNIEDSVTFATDMIERLRLLSSKRPLNLRPVDLNDVVLEMAAIADIQARSRDVMLQLKLGQGLPRVLADDVSLQHAVLDLVVNGMDALEPGGDRLVTVETCRHNGSVAILVSDTGKGIADKDREQLFQPFFTTKAEGTGLGLSIVQTIVQAHGGWIGLEDDGGPGACFRISLPLATPHAT